MQWEIYKVAATRVDVDVRQGVGGGETTAERR